MESLGKEKLKPRLTDKGEFIVEQLTRKLLSSCMTVSENRLPAGLARSQYKVVFVKTHNKS